MERIVRRLASKIARSQGLDAEREAVVAYGLLAMPSAIHSTACA